MILLSPCSSARKSSAVSVKFIIVTIEQHLAETDFIADVMSSTTFPRKPTAAGRPPLIYCPLRWSDLQGSSAGAGFMRTPGFKCNPVFTSARAWQGESVTMALFNSRPGFHFV